MTNKVSLSKINKLAIPAVLAGIVEPLIGIVDTAFVGKSPTFPVESLAAIGLATTFYFFVFWVFVQLETALSSIVSKYLGEKREKELASLITQALLLNMIIGGLLYVTTNFFIETIMRWYNAEGKVLELAINYYNIRSLGFPIALSTYTLWGVFRGLQNTWWAMLVGILGGLINVALDYLFIFGMQGWLTPMGVEGAALASLIAQVVMFIISLLIFQSQTPYKLKFEKALHPEVKNLVTISGSYMIRTISLNLVLFKANALATKLGESHMAAHTIAMQIWLFISFLLDGYANAGLALSGKLLSEKRIGALKNLIRTLLVIGVLLAFTSTVILAIGYHEIGTKFTDNSMVLSLFNSIFIFVILSQPINAIAFTYDGILKGMAAAKFIRNLMIFAALLFYITLTTLENYFHLGLSAVWVSLIFWMIFRAIVPTFYLRKTLNRA